jgi:hypothetical protein
MTRKPFSSQAGGFQGTEYLLADLPIEVFALGVPVSSLFGMVRGSPDQVGRLFNALILTIHKLYISSIPKQAHQIYVSFLSASGQKGTRQPSV